MSSRRAPISSASEKAAESSETPCPDSLDAEHDMIVGARDDAHEALVVLQRHGAAVGAERKMADANFAMRGPGRVGREPDGDDLGIGEANRGNGDMDRRRASRRR